MFSGIVQALSKKVKFKEKDYGYKISVTVPANFTKKLKKGDSVAVNGVCLTVGTEQKVMLINNRTTRSALTGVVSI